MDTQRLDSLQEKLLLRIHEASRRLMDILPYSRGLFQIDMLGELVCDDLGAPAINRERLKEVLIAIKSELASSPDCLISFTVDKDSKGRMNTSQWEIYRNLHPFLDAWLDYERTLTQLNTARHLQSFAPEAHPAWKYLLVNGRVGCADPNIQVTPREPDFRSLYVPREGYSFLIVDYKYIELCTFASIAEFKFQYSMLARVIRDNVDPHCFTAAHFSDTTLSEFIELKDTNPQHYEQQRSLAKFLNFAILCGIGPKKLVAEIQSTVHMPITESQVRAFKSKLVQQIYPEMRLYQYHDQVSLWIRNLGCNRKDFIRKCTFPRGSVFNKKTVAMISAVLRGRTKNPIQWERQLWKALVNLNRNRDLTDLLEEAYERVR